MTDDVFSVELALERLEGELAAELPAHVRGFAAAYAEGRIAPAAPAAAQRSASLDLARRGHALARASRPASRRDDQARDLSARSLALLRLLAPIAIESDAAVVAALAAEPTWDAWRALAAARDVVARRRFGVGHLALMHGLHGSTAAVSDETSWPEPVDGWHVREAPLPYVFVERAWRDLADRHGVRGTCRIVPAPNARPRAFVVEPGREVIVVIGELATPAQRFAAVHELGHAVAALLVNGTLPRVVDEAAAAYIGRLLEVEGALDLPWFTPIAAPARVRRRQLAAALDAIERGRRSEPPPTDRPPWALWSDPAAQAAYVDAESIADRWWTELGALPAAGAFADALRTERARVDEQHELAAFT